MKILFACLFVLFVTMSGFAETPVNVIMKGEATNSKGKLVYTESHTYKKLSSGEITEIQTKYHNAEGKLIAEVSADFTKDAFIPDTVFIDHRFSEKQELTYDKDSKMVTMKLTDKNGKVKTNTIARTDDMVSGSGFHNYILKHYDAKKSDIKFIVLPKLDYYSFFFQKEPSETTGQRKFVLKISSWVLRALVKEIVVEYRDADHVLMSFEGLTNIESDSHDSQILKIKLSYP
ncbi:MAG: hypothetical protein H7177_13600 [Rhizobacter sp.]|nr:hypothetical protein [Bacteriovorax sp.]